MSLDYYSFFDENGTTGFLGGIISAASDQFNAQMSSLGIKYETLDVDIFYIGEKNEITFEEAIKKRMNNLQYVVSVERDTNDINKLIESSHFEFKKIPEMKLSEIIIKMYKHEEGIDLKKISVLAKEFVELFYTEKDNMLKQYFNNSKDTEVGVKIDSLGLTKEQMKIMQTIINTVITDTMYTILLGLDGEASIGNVQQTYKLCDNNECELTNSGEIEQYAYEYFQESK